jgi:hypothetical protein
LHSVLLFALLQTCPAGNPNLVQGKQVASNLIRNYPNVIADGRLAQEGSWWEMPGVSVTLTSPEAFVGVDLGEVQEIRALVVQGDNNDVYHVDGSEDGNEWQALWNAGPVEGQGLRTRWTALPQPGRARFLRVRGSGGDGFFSVSELAAYCQVPAIWPPKLFLPPPLAWWNPAAVWHWINNDRMVGIKGTLALLGALLLVVGILLARMGRPNYLRRLRDGLLAGMGLFAVLCWWNLGHYHFDNYLHIWEHYHYYIGAKYFRELRYTRLYECTAVADMEQGFGERVKQRQMRNLETNHLEGTQGIIADPTQCTRHFTPARWSQFKTDVAFFRGQMAGDTWANSQKDHGYNGTPVWGIVGGILANLYPAGERFYFLGLSERGVPYIAILGALDSIILCVMWAVIVWAFGWRTACVAALYWGTNYPARYWWNGGAYLRMDWLVASMIGICLVKRGKMAGGGAALTYGALLRIFPGFIVFGLIGKVLARMVRERRFVLAPEHWQFAKGCVAALVVLVPLSAALGGGGQKLGLDTWVGGSRDPVGFVQNSQKHLHTPLTNNMGLKTVVAFEYGTRAHVTRNMALEDPFQVWKAARNAAFEHRKVFFLLLVVGFMVLLGWAAEKQEDWVALALGVGMIPVASELTCYYYSFGLAFGFLYLKRPWAGAAACLLGAVSCAITAVPMWAWDDERYTWISLAYFLFIIGITAVMGWQAHREAAAQAALPDDKARPVLTPAAVSAVAAPVPVKTKAKASAPSKATPQQGRRRARKRR